MGHAGQLMTHRFNHWPNGLIESITSLIFKIMGGDKGGNDSSGDVGWNMVVVVE